MLISLSNKENDYYGYLFFLTFNCLGNSLQTLNASIEELVLCEISRIDYLKDLKNIFLIIGLCILGASFLFLTFYLLTIDQNLDSVWEALRHRSHRHFFDIREQIIERLSDFHHENDFVDNDLESMNYKKSTPLHFKHSVQYLLKFSILFIITGLVILVTFLVFYENIENSLYSRTGLISTLGERRVLTTELSFYTLENTISGSNFSLYETFKGFNGIPDPVDGFLGVISKINKVMKYYQDPSIKSLMSSSLEQSIYQNNSNTSAFLSFGTYLGLNYLIQESFYLAQNKNPDQSRTFFLDIMTIDSLVTNNFILANNNSQAIIQNQLSYLICFDSSSTSFILFVMIAIYTPILMVEIKVLTKIINILKIIPGIKKVSKSDKTKNILSNTSQN